MMEYFSHVTTLESNPDITGAMWRQRCLFLNYFLSSNNPSVSDIFVILITSKPYNNLRYVTVQ